MRYQPADQPVALGFSNLAQSGRQVLGADLNRSESTNPAQGSEVRNGSRSEKLDVSISGPLLPSRPTGGRVRARSGHCRRSPNGRYGIFESGLPCQSALMPTNFTTLPHFSVSSATNVPNSAGVMDVGMLPTSANRPFNLGSARAALISLLSLSMISAGVFLGAPRPDQLLAS